METEPIADAEPEMQMETPTEPATRSEARYPLAFDAHGNPVKVPADAVAWRVRRGGGRRGRPRNVFDSTTGRQLEIPLGAGLENLMETNVPPDRYLLYPVDAAGSIIPGLIAVTEVPETDEDEEPTGSSADAVPGLDKDSKNPLIALLARQLATIDHMADSHVAQSKELAQALHSAVNGNPANRSAPHVAPIMIEPSASPSAQAQGGFLGGMSPEQIGQMLGMAKTVFDMIKGAGSSGPTGVGAPVGASAGAGGAVGGGL
jgi:hypothetical protein